MDMIYSQFGNDSNTNSTTYSNAVGYGAVTVSVFFFGSSFLPVKKFETGDGMFFQWVLCTAIWISGMVTQVVCNFPRFYPLAMLGGFLWSTGNLMVVPIIKTVGLGQGILIWAFFNMVSGWASGRFGWFGLCKENVRHSALNYAGIATCSIGSFLYIFIKSEIQLRVSDTMPDINVLYNQRVTHDADAAANDDDGPLLPQVHAETSINGNGSPNETFFLEKLTLVQRKILGVVLSVISGLLYGLNFAPVIYIKDNYDNASQRDVDYVFAHYCGIFTTSTFYFIVYCIICKNRPTLYPQAILPAIVSGLMWAIADIGWFLANNVLSEAVSFPLITSGPALLAAIWGIILKEIRGRRNFIVLFVAGSITLTGSVLTGMSK